MLQDKLSAIRDASAEKIPQEKLGKMLQAKEALGSTDILQRAIKVGETFPAFVLPDANGSQVSSQEILQRGPMLITLFRGVW